MSAPQKPDSDAQSLPSDHHIEPSAGSSYNEPRIPTNFRVYKPARASAALPNLPDSFYTPTTADLRAVQAQLAARTQALTNAPLQLRAQRVEMELKARLDRWPETKIRIKFIDGTQLEKVFPSTNKIRSIYAFVRNCLTEEVKPIKFILYQPPNRDLKVSDLTVRDLSLSQLQLAPSSILLLRFTDESLNHDNIPAPLDPCILSQAVDLSPPPQIDDKGEGPSKKTPSKTPITTTSSGKGAGVKVPKWLKLGGKK